MDNPNRWFAGKDREFFALAREKQKELAFAATRCTIAHPNWPRMESTCLHAECRVWRGEKPRSFITESGLAWERSNGMARMQGYPDD